MSSYTKLLLVALFLLVTPAAFAQNFDDGVFNMEGISDGCSGTMNADQCMFGDSTWTATYCTKDACPACAFNETQTKSVCYYLTGNYGYCSCTGAGVAYDSHGQKYANCTTNGSCVNHR
jgi:hypothetical protein